MKKNDLLLAARKRQARVFLQTNRLQEAAEKFTAIHRSNKRDKEALVNLGVIHRRLGNFQCSEEYCKLALDMYPEDPQIHLNLGAALQCKNATDSAIACYREAIKLSPDYAVAHYFLANILRENNRIDEAIAEYLTAINIQPDFLQALGNLGAAFNFVGNSSEALVYLERARALSPDNPHILCNIADAMLAEGREKEALKLAEQLVKDNPQFADAHYSIGCIQRHRGDFSSAFESFKTVLENQRDHLNATAAIAELLETLGDYELAARYLVPYLQLQTVPESIASSFASVARHIGKSAEAIQIGEKSLEQAPSNPRSRMNLHYKLGSLLDEEGRYAAAFRHYETANNISTSLGYNLDNRSDKDSLPPIINNWVCSLPADFWEHLPRATLTDTRPIFVVGMPRSGTTLMEQILACHSKIYGCGELTEIDDISQSLRSGTSIYPESIATLTVSDCNIAGAKYLQRLEGYPGDYSRLVDKMPYNFLHLGLISRILPTARIIHMRRNPLDTCLSIYFQSFNASISSASDLKKLGKYYNEYLILMDYWKSVLDIEYLEIEYESLVKHQEAVSRQTIEFCGLHWEEACLDFHKNKRDINTPSYNQVRQPMYNSSINRWKNYAEQLEELREILLPLTSRA